jgi:hypothetical protein
MPQFALSASQYAQKVARLTRDEPRQVCLVADLQAGGIRERDRQSKDTPEIQGWGSTV